MITTTAGTIAPVVDVAATLRELARSEPGIRPVISVYLDTRWSDEHQRERVRVFLKNHVRQTATSPAGELESELAWIVAEGERVVGQALHPEAAGVAMFAGGPAALRVLVHVAVPFADAFTVADRPRLRPFVAALGDAPRAAVLFVDAASARLVAITEQGPADDIALESPDPLGHHRRGGWQLLMQSRYQRHIHEHRKRHFDAVTEALGALVDQYGVRAIVLAGEPRNVSVFSAQLPSRLASRIIGDVSGSRYESSGVLAERALGLLHQRAVGDAAAALDAVLTDAEAGGRAAAGVDATIDAVNRGTVDRLYLMPAFEEMGRVCAVCRALQRGSGAACRWCGGATSMLELGEPLVQRVLAAGGDVASIDAHAGLERAGGVAARLRYR